MKFKQFLLLLLIVFFSGLIYHFRSMPTGQLWDNYTVFYVEDSVDDEIIVKAFYETGVKEYVSLAGQETPIKLEEGSLASLMFQLNLSSSDESEYLIRRNQYFYDSSKNYRIYYIPNRYKTSLDKTVKYLDKVSCNGKSVFSGVDSSVAFPWALPVIVVVVSIIVMFLLKKKNIFFFGMIVPVLFVFCNPFYSCAAAVLLTIPPMVVICNLWYRDGATVKIVKNPIVWISLVIGLISAFAGSVFSGLYFAAAVLSQYAFVLIGRLYEKNKYANQTYTFVNIKPLKMFPAYNGKAKIIFPVLLLGVASVFVSYKLYSTTTATVKSHFAKVLLPGSVKDETAAENTSTNDFPSLDEYYRWNWDIISYPMRSLNFEEADTDSVVFPRYMKDEKGITRVDEVFSFDDAFKKTVYDNIDTLGFNNIEQVIKSQGSDFKCGYTTAQNYQVSLFSIIMIIICFIMLLFIYISAIIRKGGRK